ncbi:MAG: response regulator [Actinomycetota bacterium]|nr:response regulator [Actinomycetota bacterium]
MTESSNKTVLVVEDNPGDVDLIHEALDQPMRTQWEIRRAGKLAEAFERLRQDQVDIVLLDLSLPDAHGLETLTRLNARVGNTPIVVLTGQYNEDVGLEALKHGAQDYLVKGRVDGPILSRVMEYAIERKHSERALRESERRYRLVVENARETITVLDVEGRVLYASPSHETILGYAPDEMVGVRFEDLVHPDDASAAARNVAKALASEESGGTNIRVRHKQGHWVAMERTATLIHDDPTQDPLVLAISRDVTDRARAERRITAQHEVTRVLAESTTLSDATPRILEAVCTSLAWDMGALWRLDRDAEVLHCVDVWRFPGLDKELEALTRRIEMPRGIGLPGRVWEQRAPVWIRDAPIDPTLPRTAAMRQADIHTGFGFPIVRGDEFLGVMEFFAREGREPDEDLLRMMSAVGSQIGQFVERKLAEEEVMKLNAELEERVRERTSQLEAANHNLKDQISHRKSAEETARNAQREAERANRAKSEFLSGMSHELRTPLNGILGFAQLLEMDDLNEEQQDSVQQILRAGRHLLSLINEILDIGRIESGHLTLSMEPVDVHALVQECVGLLRPLAFERNIAIEVDAPPGSCSAMADQQRLKQVVLNLLSNAVKYNDEGGTVRASISDALENRVRLEVVDSGQGMAAEDLERVFRAFERLPSSYGVQGTGLGLALSKRLVEAMGGAIGVRSEVGAGSTFWLELAVPAQGHVEAEAPQLEPSRSGLSRRVLYIEDNLSNFSLVERLLTPLEISLMPAMQGQLGFDLAREHRPDLILLDLHLPDLPGEEVLKWLRTDPATRQIPVIIVSADATQRHAKALAKLGVHAYLTKPLDVRKFLRVIGAALDGDRGDSQARLADTAPRAEA